MRNLFSGRVPAAPGIALVTIALLVAACGGAAQQTQPPTPSPAVATQAPVQPTAAATGGAGGGTQATIVDFAFEPASMEVQVGDTVTWTNEGGVAHTVTFDDGPDSGNLAPGDTFEHTFDAAGEFDYICSIHPSMEASVSVSP